MNIQVKRVTIINIEIELDHISQYTTVKHKGYIDRFSFIYCNIHIKTS